MNHAGGKFDPLLVRSYVPLVLCLGTLSPDDPLIRGSYGDHP